MAKSWYCSKVNINRYEIGGLRKLLDELEAIEKDGYKVEHIVYVEADEQYQVFYSKED